MTDDLDDKDYAIVFDTYIDGQLARVEIPVDAKILTSREARNNAETLARICFAQLHPKFHARQRIKAVDIVKLQPAENAGGH